MTQCLASGVAMDISTRREAQEHLVHQDIRAQGRQASVKINTDPEWLNKKTEVMYPATLFNT